jgi:hypothetical protein
MDVVYKGGSLLYTQLSSVARMALSLPRYVLANLSQQQSQAAEPHPGVLPSQPGHYVMLLLVASVSDWRTVCDLQHQDACMHLVEHMQLASIEYSKHTSSAAVYRCEHTVIQNRTVRGPVSTLSRSLPLTNTQLDQQCQCHTCSGSGAA